LHTPEGAGTDIGQRERERTEVRLKADTHMHCRNNYILLCMDYVGSGSEILRTNDITLDDEVTRG